MDRATDHERKTVLKQLSGVKTVGMRRSTARKRDTLCVSPSRRGRIVNVMTPVHAWVTYRFFTSLSHGESAVPVEDILHLLKYKSDNLPKILEEACNIDKRQHGEPGISEAKMAGVSAVHDIPQVIHELSQLLARPDTQERLDHLHASALTLRGVLCMLWP